MDTRMSRRATERRAGPEAFARSARRAQSILVAVAARFTPSRFHPLELGTFNATELAAKVGPSAQNVNNRLKRLVTGGALARRRVAARTGGKEFIYPVPGQLAGCDS